MQTAEWPSRQTALSSPRSPPLLNLGILEEYSASSSGLRIDAIEASMQAGPCTHVVYTVAGDAVSKRVASV